MRKWFRDLGQDLKIVGREIKIMSRPRKALLPIMMVLAVAGTLGNQVNIETKKLNGVISKKLYRKGW